MPGRAGEYMLLVEDATMGAGHVHHRESLDGGRGRLAAVFGLSLVYMLAEVAGGLLTNSLALLADAAHMFTDVAALALALFATEVARRPPSGRQTYGYFRAEILAALVNGATLLGVAAYIFLEAFGRLSSPPAVQGAAMAAIAVGGLVVNLLGLRILAGGAEEDLNVHGAWLHVLTDALGSLGAIAGGLLVWAFGWHLADPIVSILIAVLVVYSSWALLKATLAVLMEEAPGHIDVDEVRAAILAVPGVLGLHDLHVWTITSGLVSASVHVVGDDETAKGCILRDVRALLDERFGIAHSTIQLDPDGDGACHRGCEPAACVPHGRPPGPPPGRP